MADSMAAEPQAQGASTAPAAENDASGAANPIDAVSTAADAEQQAGDAPKPNTKTKRKIAMFLAYVGHGYQGMQRNPGAKTIEEDLFDAIHKAGGISDANADENGFMKIHWMRAARTDKGVSAVGQVVSLKMVLEPPGMLERINANLPPQIRVFGFSRATNGFDSRKHCDKRRYEYILPEWAFDAGRSLPRAQQQQARRQAAAAAAAQEAQQAAAEFLDQMQVDSQAAAAGGAAAAAAAAAVVNGAAAEQAQLPAAAEGAPAAAQAEQQAQQQPAAVQDQEVTAIGVGDDDATADPAALAAAEAADEAEQAAAAAAAAAAEDAAAEAAPAAEAEAGGGEAGSAEEEAAVTAEGGGGNEQKFVFDAECKARVNKILSHYEGTHNYHNFTVRKLASAPDAKRYILSFRCEGVLEIKGERWVKLVVVGQSFMLHQIRKMVGMAVAVARGTASIDALKLAMKTTVGLNVPMAPELGLFLDECYYDAYNNQWGHMHQTLRLSDYQQAVDAFKAEQLYPHIAARDAEEHVNASWLRSLNEAAFKFSEWPAQVAAVRVGGGRSRPLPKGAGAAALVGSFEGYGHKRKADGGRGGGGGGGKRGRGAGGGALQASMDAEYSD